MPPDEDPHGRDRRQYERAHVQTTALVRTKSSSRRATFTVDSLSIGGARMTGPLALQVKDQIAITLELAGRSFEMPAEVVRVESPDLMTDHIAIRFLDIPEEAQAPLRQMVSEALELDSAETIEAD